MNFNWLDYLKFAKHIKDNPSVFGNNIEAAYRTAASRAYYAAFKYALNLAKNEGFIPSKTGDDHIKIRAYLRETASKNEKRRKASVELERLYNLRRVADYDDVSNYQPYNLAFYAIGMADRITSILQDEKPQ